MRSRAQDWQRSDLTALTCFPLHNNSITCSCTAPQPLPDAALPRTTQVRLAAAAAVENAVVMLQDHASAAGLSATATAATATLSATADLSKRAGEAGAANALVRREAETTAWRVSQKEGVRATNAALSGIAYQRSFSLPCGVNSPQRAVFRNFTANLRLQSLACAAMRNLAVRSHTTIT